jgi:hypothetical protein
MGFNGRPSIAVKNITIIFRIKSCVYDAFKLRHYCRPICCVILEIILECKREFKELILLLLVELIAAGQFVQNSKTVDLI